MVKDIIEALKGLKIGEKLTIVDLSRYKAETSRTGGDYLFGVSLTKVDNDLYLKRYFTSAEFSFCGARGSFDYCPDDRPCCPGAIRVDGDCMVPLTLKGAVREVRSIGWPHPLHEATEWGVMESTLHDLPKVRRAAKKALREYIEIWGDDDV